jgi:DNA-binding NarL/FixJ family response regulator
MAKTILIVDDNSYMREALCELIECEPELQVCGEAENGKEAIEKACLLRPDLIVLDLTMPVMNGLEAASLLKQLMPEIPIIMYSASIDSFTEHEARLAGISAIVCKLESETLITKAHNLLDTRTGYAVPASTLQPSCSESRGETARPNGLVDDSPSAPELLAMHAFPFPSSLPD